MIQTIEKSVNARVGLWKSVKKRTVKSEIPLPLLN